MRERFARIQSTLQEQGKAQIARRARRTMRASAALASQIQLGDAAAPGEEGRLGWG